jgi:hypothetical protein
MGCANGTKARGGSIFVGRQIGLSYQCKFKRHDERGQFPRTLEGIVAVLKKPGAAPEYVTTMIWYVLDRKACRR